MKVRKAWQIIREGHFTFKLQQLQMPPLPLHAFDLLQSLFHLVQGQEGFMHDAGPEAGADTSPQLVAIWFGL